MSRWAGLALVSSLLVGAGTRGPQELVVEPDARTAMHALWAASVAARAERVACLASATVGETLRVTRIQALDAGADSLAVSATASLGMCGPPEWQGTVHTHITLADGRRPYALFSGSDRGVMLMWWRRWNADGTFCLLFAADQAHCEIDGSRLVILPSVRY